MARLASLLGAMFLVMPLEAWAQAVPPAAPATKATEPGARAVPPPKQAQWPKTLPEAKPAAHSPRSWSKAEIDEAQSRCKAVLAGLDVVAVPVEPMREGDCGAPAPIEVISVGKNPQVSLSTPSVLTCDMAAALEKWVKTDVQPAAREVLGSPVVRLDVMSAYSCRNAYGRQKTRMSEHGRANALDIKAFITQKGDSVDVMADWGQTERDIKAQIAAAAAATRAAEAKAENIRREAERRDAERRAAAAKEKDAAAARQAAHPKVPSPQVAAPATTPEPRQDVGTGNETALRGSVAEPELRQGVRTWRPFPAVPELSLQPSHLGGPKAADAPVQVAQAVGPIAATPATIPTPKQRFLRRLHVSACKAFMTILGPEANEAHRNHFHIDMAERQSGSFCE